MKIAKVLIKEAESHIEDYQMLLKWTLKAIQRKFILNSEQKEESGLNLELQKHPEIRFSNLEINIIEDLKNLMIIDQIKPHVTRK